MKATRPKFHDPFQINFAVTGVPWIYLRSRRNPGMKLFTRNVFLATLGFAVLNAGKATVVGYPPPTDVETFLPYYPTLFALSLVYAWAFKYVWLKLDEKFEEDAEVYEPREWTEED